MIPFIKIPYIFYSHLSLTYEEFVAIFLMSDLSFIKNLPKGDKIELASQLAHNMLKAGTIFSPFSVGRNDVLALGDIF